MKLKFWHGILIMGIVIILLLLDRCNKDRVHNQDVEALRNYKDTVMQYKGQNGVLIDYNNSLELSRNTFLENATDSLKTFLENIKIPEPNIITIIKERFYVDSIPSVSLNVDCEFDTTFIIIDSNYRIAGSISNEFLSLKEIMIPNTITMVIGDRKEKWWKKREHIATITHSNPYINSTGIQSFVLQEKQSRWSVGPSIGYGFYYDPWKGNVGHGITGAISVNFRILGFKKK